MGLILIISCIGGDPEKVKKSERDRFRDDKIVDEIIEIDGRWRKCKYSQKFLIPHMLSEV